MILGSAYACGGGGWNTLYILRSFSMQASANALDYRTTATPHGSIIDSANIKTPSCDEILILVGVDGIEPSTNSL